MSGRLFLRRPVRCAGLTLVELLVALAIIGLLAVLSYRAISILAAGRDRLMEETRRWQEVARLFSRIETDLWQTIPASRGDPRGALRTPAPGMLTLSRFRGEAVGVESVTYSLAEASLFLDEQDWLAPPALEAERQPILTGVRALRWEFLGFGNEWLAQWPPAGSESFLPRAVRLTVDVDGIGPLVRIFAPR